MRHSHRKRGETDRPRLRSTAPALDPTALDFMHDTLYGGRRFCTLKVLDEGNREGLAIEVATALQAPLCWGDGRGRAVARYLYGMLR